MHSDYSELIDNLTDLENVILQAAERRQSEALLAESSNWKKAPEVEEIGGVQ